MRHSPLFQLDRCVLRQSAAALNAATRGLVALIWLMRRLRFVGLRSPYPGHCWLIKHLAGLLIGVHRGEFFMRLSLPTGLLTVLAVLAATARLRGG